MIPTSWIEDRQRLVAKRHEQSDKSYPWSPGEKAVADADLDALNALPVTFDELLVVNISGRGQYKDGDTRGYVFAQEQICTSCNAWMIRHLKGDEQYISENPADILADGREIPIFVD